MRKFDTNFIDRISSLKDSELELLFEEGMCYDSMSLSSEKKVTFAEWLNSRVEDICASKVIVSYFNREGVLDKREFLVAVGLFLSTWLPESNALIAAEMLFRLGIKKLCNEERTL